MEELKNGYVSPSSSPPTPPSPLPISVGPGNQKYFFSPSPSPSPPFSPSNSNHASAENLPLLHYNRPSAPLKQVTSAFSLDRKDPDELEDKSSSCLKDLNAAIAPLNPSSANTKIPKSGNCTVEIYIGILS
ncbi:hypothetical protein COLO4_31166 [Corchorus olitorius]|uniref:Uncharacterized protein n=1 Tax=Corchorus olitorius TaxID=93759 RepID=A0A1R3H5J3_9ROSI|nr:hypothetical protein COLO4_31166 [Corchorus olitorius]